jgi:hypothetical protein
MVTLVSGHVLGKVGALLGIKTHMSDLISTNTECTEKAITILRIEGGLTIRLNCAPHFRMNSDGPTQTPPSSEADVSRCL